MIRIVGDTHGDTRRMASLDAQLQDGDYLLVCGDFGFVFLDDVHEKRFLDDLEYRPYTILFVDGNHENFDALERFPEEMWHGGRVHRLRKNILHLQRGQVFEIEGKTFYTFGGGYSIDKAMRTEGYSWWPQEMPTDAQYKEGNENLAAHGNCVDYIITHTAPLGVLEQIGLCHGYEEFPLNNYLQYVAESVRFSAWFMGHFHMDKSLYGGYRLLFSDIHSV